MKKLLVAPAMGRTLISKCMRLARAGPLKVEYPCVTDTQLTQEPENLSKSGHTNILFICSRNQWRSPTAEQVWRKHPSLSVRSGGTSPNARHPVSESDLIWAEVIFVMEEKHKSRLLAGYRQLLENKPIHVLDIPDEYRYMDPELVELFRESVGAILGLE